MLLTIDEEENMKVIIYRKAYRKARWKKKAIRKGRRVFDFLATNYPDLPTVIKII